MDAFKSAVISKESAQNKGVNQITSGIKDAVVAIGGGISFATGATNVVGQSFQHGLANRIGGIGGNLMLNMMQEKKITDDDRRGYTDLELDEAKAGLEKEIADQKYATADLFSGGTTRDRALEALGRLTPSDTINTYRGVLKNKTAKDVDEIQSFIDPLGFKNKKEGNE